ncbi:MAG TPA: hypothetical protein VHY22_05845, partial [Chthoniobacteraceae bacterium]|nr:hypothetical protein [Chthoniobacteraceae bacterium]
MNLETAPPLAPLKIIERERNFVQPPNMDFFPGFKWAVTTAFRDPLGACRFEQGDALYNTRSAYAGEWRDALAVLEYGIDITSPPRAQSAALKHEDSGVFERNWGTKVEFDLVNYKDGKRKQPITTTQGRLYTFLRTGNFSLFDQNTDAPQCPKLVLEVNRAKAKKETKEAILETIQGIFLKRMTECIAKPNLFILAFDETNPVSRAKMVTIRDCLRPFNFSSLILTPEEAGLSDWQDFTATLSFIGFCMDSGASEKIRDALKAALYKPAKMLDLPASPNIEGQEAKPKPDAFKLRRHGLFIPAKEHKTNGDIFCLSFAHGHFYRYRVSRSKEAKAPQELIDYLELIKTDCVPNDYFNNPPFCSDLDSKLSIALDSEELAPITRLARASFTNEKYKMAHENLEVYLLENDPLTIATEIPVWLEPAEYDFYETLCSNKGEV